MISAKQAAQAKMLKEALDQVTYEQVLAILQDYAQSKLTAEQASRLGQVIERIGWAKL